MSFIGKSYPAAAEEPQGQRPINQVSSELLKEESKYYTTLS
jgi:hypothetical protein